jgi:hypothetical protein
MHPLCLLTKKAFYLPENRKHADITSTSWLFFAEKNQIIPPLPFIQNSASISKLCFVDVLTVCHEEGLLELPLHGDGLKLPYQCSQDGLEHFDTLKKRDKFTKPPPPEGAQTP